jgi:HEPN domain-containing protein
VNFSAIPQSTQAERNQSVLERDRARGVSISTAPVDPVQAKRESLRNIPLVGEILGGKKDFEPLYADGTMGNIFVDGVRRDGIIGFITEGFRKKFQPTEAELGERFYTRYDKLVENGVEPERAQEVAMTDLIRQTNGEAENIQDLYNPEAELSSEEKSLLRFNNVLEDVFAVLDAPIFVGSTKVVKAPLIKALQQADNVTDATKVLRNIDVADEVAEEYATKIISSSNELEIARFLDEAVEASRALNTEKARKLVETVEANRVVTTPDEFVPESRVADEAISDEALPSPTAITPESKAIQADEVALAGKGSDEVAEIASPIVRTENAKIVDDLAEDVAQITEDVSKLTDEVRVAYQSVGRNADLPEFYEADKVLSDIFNEMDLAEAGARKAYVYEDGFGTIDKILSKQSTFPDWVPDELRRKDLFQKVFGGLDLNNLKYPVGNRPAQRRLYDAILDEADSRLGVDTRAIRDDILKSYEKGNTTRASNRSTSGGSAVREGGDTAGERVTSEATPTESVSEAVIANTQEAQTKSNPLLGGNQDDPLVKAGERSADSVEASSYNRYDIVKTYDNKGESIEQFSIFDVEEGVDFIVEDNKKLLATLRTDITSPENLKDISGFKGQARDIYRNTEEVFGDQYPVIKKKILDPFDDAKGAMVRDIESILKEFDEKVVTGLKIKKKSKESKAVMDYGEKLITKDDLVKQFGAKRAEDIVEADKWFRRQYDTMLDEVNAMRKQIYPRSPEKWIPKRQDYYRHFQDLSSTWGGLANIFDTPSAIDPRLSAISPFTKPKSKFLSFAQTRLGVASERDAVGGFLNYVQPYGYAKHVDPHINDFRILAKSLAEQTLESRNVNNYIEFLGDYANDLAGKTNPADRYIQKVIPYGRQAFRAIDWTNSRVKLNTILGNVSSSIAQIFNVPQGIGSAKHHSINGAIRSISDIWNPSKAIKQSNFVTERYSQSMYDQFNVGMLENGKQFAGWMIGVLDEVGTKFIWNSHYEKAMREGIEEPVRYADDMARKLVAGRGVGEVPIMQKAKMFQLVAPFQLEVTNLWWVMGDFIRKDKNGRRNLSALATTFVAMYLMNDVAERIRGNNVGFDPINAIWEGYKIAETEEDIDQKLLKFGGRVSGEVLSNVPLGQTIASAYPEYGTNIGGTQLPTREDLFGEGDPTRFGSGLLVVKGLQDPFFKLLPPFGGSQVKKTLEGAQSLITEDVTDKGGNIMYSVDRDVPTAMKVLLFGKYSTPEAREFFDQDKIKQQVEAEMRSLYRENQTLIGDGYQSIAQSNVNELSDDAYDIYKKVKREEEKEAEEEAIEAMMGTVRQTRAMLENGAESEAQAVVDAMSDEEYEIYEKAKKKLTVDNQETNEQDIIGVVFTYAQAIGTDPITAFDHIFSGEKIRRVDNRTIIVERLPFSESNEIKKERGATGTMRLDHTMPLQLGGSNSPDNLKLVPFEEWDSYTPVENHLGKLLRDDKIEKRQAQDLIIQFKNGEISADEILKLK